MFSVSYLRLNGVEKRALTGTYRLAERGAGGGDAGGGRAGGVDACGGIAAGAGAAAAAAPRAAPTAPAPAQPPPLHAARQPHEPEVRIFYILYLTPAHHSNRLICPACLKYLIR